NRGSGRRASLYRKEPIASRSGEPARPDRSFRERDSMNEHEAVRAMLALSAAVLLSPDEVRRVEEHVRTCELCRTDLETWAEYAQGLRKLPQTSAPAGLMERTRAKIVQEHAVAAGRQRHAWLLGALVI